MGNARWSVFSVRHLETDLWIAVDRGDKKDAAEFALQRVAYYRKVLDAHIREHPEFSSSLEPLPLVSEIHPLAEGMYRAASAAGTGPMSAVAGAFAEFICRDLLDEFVFSEVVVENGGDIFLKLESPAVISVFAGDSPLSGKIGVTVKPSDSPLSICCSSATIGHSFSMGEADACMIACRSGALADAYATAFCNMTINSGIISSLADKALGIPDIMSVVIIKDDIVGLGGSLEFVFRDS
jgi:ApbE superfamily uncharacterized protein (UPF0280 family)